MTGIEPVTSSLPRKRSTSELHRQKCVPAILVAREGFEPTKLAQQIYSLPSLTA